MVKSSHPPLDTILISQKGGELKASPFKIPDEKTLNFSLKIEKIIQQNNFINQALHTIGQQLYPIEEKVEKTVSK